jgi:hypothetical protein
VTIKPGQPWGRRVDRPDGLVTVVDDAGLAAALCVPDGPPVAVGSGDLARTLGVGPSSDGSMVNEFPIDLLRVHLDDADEPVVACAHVIARSGWASGHWLRGRILAVMNAEFIGVWDVAPRGHPNDGRVEVFDVDARLPLRQRVAARARLRTGTHAPHPRITTTSVRKASWTFEHPLEVIVDGQPRGRASTLRVEVVPDAAVVYA